MAKIKLDDSWSNAPKVVEKHKDIMLITSPSQRKLMTPVFINSTTLEILKDAYMQLFRQSGILYTPSAFRYSYSFRVKGRNIMATTLYHLERDFNMMQFRYGITIHTETLKLSGAAWEREAYDMIDWFDLDCKRAQHKLIKTLSSVGGYIGWSCKEVFPDNAVK